ncbi:hypothetical protein [Mangrovibacterium diazotrophicum]|uniref:Uncharacterized protein n=1 Tax=Mangrovibacterium diazotrophicum TaxID=1261403 RepID=A0A419WBM4_9BACT|nr:hypothetical protein [Mangrovibacterium diazotrophicum]RKD92867.1 hypothetical protein BC643_3244 [Mangrovibacterium diazotrophicum]
MTKRDFFILVIKLFGLYSIITAVFFTLPSNVSFIIMDFGVTSILYLLAILFVIVALFVFLIFKASQIVNLLKLDKGFDNDKIELGNLTTVEIVKIATFIIGGFLIINNIPVFINQTINTFYTDIQSQAVTPTYKWNWFVNGLNILIGYLLITNLNFVARLLRLENNTEK